jgi:hypothetical protein
METPPLATHPGFPSPAVSTSSLPPSQKKVSRCSPIVPFTPITDYSGQQPQQMTASQQQQMQMYLHQQQLAVAARYGQTQQAQGLTSNGTPVNINAVWGTMPQHPQTAANAARPTPLNGSIPQTSRSPMPPGQQPGVVSGQHMQQPATVQQYNYAPNPYMARVTAMQALQQAQAQAQRQAQAQSQPSLAPRRPLILPGAHARINPTLTGFSQSSFASLESCPRTGERG